MLSFAMSLSDNKPKNDTNPPETEERRVTTDRRSGIDRRVVNQKLVGLDMDRGFARFDGDKAAWYEILRTFANDMRQRIEEIHGVSKGKLADYANIMHDIKDASRGITAEMLGESAEKLEEAAMGGNFEFVSMHNPVFLSALRKLVGDIDEAILEFEANNKKPARGKPDDATLAKLRDACEDYRMDGVDEAMDELKKYQYDSDDGLVDWLKEKVEQMNFNEIVERLT